MQDDNFTLDELIKIVNNNKTASTEVKLPPIAEKPNKQQQSFSNCKTLMFKPWSGKYIKTGECQRILQQIDGIEEESENQGDKQTDSQAKNKQIIASVQESDLGYFYKFPGAHVRLIKHLLQENGFKQNANANNNWTIFWSSSAIKMQTYHALLPYQKINHFPHSFYITRKDLMNKCISKMQDRHGYSHFNFLPKTFLLPQQYDQFLQEYNKFKTMYIVKPHNRSQGKGITVTDSLDVINNKLEKYSSLIVSHYISNPLLINKLKFDLRIYVAITGINPLRIYIYQEGLARFATEQYDQNIEDPQSKRFQHLTNYSVNKKNTFFVPSNNEEYFGSKWSLTSLKDFLTYNIGKQETQQLFEKVDDVIIKTIISGENILYTAFHNHVPNINNCFEVLGFDILIDSNLKPWLVQVNMSPSMNTDSPLDLKIKGQMIADLLSMIGVTPLNQRYSDGGHIKYQTHYYMRNDNRTQQKSAVDRFVLKEIQNEYNRRGGWRRVFPNGINTNRYKNFFDTDRYFNRLLREPTQNYQSVGPSIFGKAEVKHSVLQYRSHSMNPKAKQQHNKTKKNIRISRAKQKRSFLL